MPRTAPQKPATELDERPILMITGDAMDAMLDAAALASKEEDAMDAMLDAAALASKQQEEEDAEMTTGTCAA